MSNVREFHNQAIQSAQHAMQAAHLKNEGERVRLVSEAMDYEIKAAELLPEEEAVEPTRAMLYQSAASFAYQAGKFQEAERLVFKGLSGYPTPIAKAQLLDVQSMIQEAIQDEKPVDIWDEGMEAEFGPEPTTVEERLAFMHKTAGIWPIKDEATRDWIDNLSVYNDDLWI